MEKITPFREMTSKQKVTYIIDYYKWHIIITLVVLSVLGSIIHMFLTKKENITEIMFINYISETNEEPDCFDDFLTEYDYDPAEQDVPVNTAFVFDVNSTGSYQQMNVLNALLISDTYSGFFSDRETFMHYANQGMFQDMSPYISDEILKKYEEDLIYLIDEETNLEYLAGIHLTSENSNWINTYHAYEDCYFSLCFCPSTKEEVLHQLCKFILK